jgi:hypothetical protein
VQLEARISAKRPSTLSEGQCADKLDPGDRVLFRHIVEHPERWREAYDLGVGVGHRNGDVEGGDRRGPDGERVEWHGGGVEWRLRTGGSTVIWLDHSQIYASMSDLCGWTSQNLF